MVRNTWLECDVAAGMYCTLWKLFFMFLALAADIPN